MQKAKLERQNHKVKFKSIIFFTFILNLYLFTFTHSLSHAEPKKASMAGLEKLFLEARYDKALSEADRLIDERSSNRDEIYYLKGLSLLKLSRFKEAREAFAKIISKFQMSIRAFDAYVGIGDSYFLEGDMREAIRSYEDLLKKYPDDKNIIVVRNRLEDCRHAKGRAIKEPFLPPKTSNSNSTRTVSFSVQVGYFKTKSNAERLARRLARKNYDSYVDTSSDSRDTFYRVKVGRAASKDEAQKLALKLKTLGYSTKICTDDLCQ